MFSFRLRAVGTLFERFTIRKYRGVHDRVGIGCEPPASITDADTVRSRCESSRNELASPWGRQTERNRYGSVRFRIASKNHKPVWPKGAPRTTVVANTFQCIALSRNSLNHAAGDYMVREREEESIKPLRS